MEPLISVLIPAYNAAGTIHAAISSVLNQTEPAWEIVVADDGSEDTTVQVVQRLKEKTLQGDKIRVVRLSHGGCASATHQGILRCRAEVVTILDSDDMIYPTALRTVLRNFEGETCYLWTRFRTSLWEQQAHASMGWARDLPSAYPTLKEAFLHTEWWGASHQRAFRKSTYTETPTLNMRWQTAVDLQLCLLFAGTGLPTRSVDAVTYYYRKSDKQMSRVQRAAQHQAHREMIHEWRLLHGGR